MNNLNMQDSVGVINLTFKIRVFSLTNIEQEQTIFR